MCWGHPMTASVGQLLVPGGSKNSRMVAARCLRVRPSLRSSTSRSGAPTCGGDDELLHDELAEPSAGVSVGGGHVLVYASSCLDFCVLLVVEQCFEACLLLLGEEPGTGVESAASFVDRVVTLALAAQSMALAAAATLLEGVSS